jgi:hypothetical protein
VLRRFDGTPYGAPALVEPDFFFACDLDLGDLFNSLPPNFTGASTYKPFDEGTGDRVIF